MGIVGVLLAGGCPYPGGQNASSSGWGRDVGSGCITGGAKVTVGSSMSSGTKGKGKQVARVTSTDDKRGARVLIVAPSNAAVDELVLRLCQDGVPGADGGVFFPKVVRVGGPRGDSERDGDGDEGRGDRSGSGSGSGARQSMHSSVVQVRWVGSRSVTSMWLVDRRHAETRLYLRFRFFLSLACCWVAHARPSSSYDHSFPMFTRVRTSRPNSIDPFV